MATLWLYLTHAKCARCEKGIGKDPCVEKKQCEICDIEVKLPVRNPKSPPTSPLPRRKPAKHQQSFSTGGACSEVRCGGDW